MTSENDVPLSTEESELAELLSVLKQVQPTLEGRLENRMSVARELAKLQVVLPPPNRPRWRRFVSGSLPFVTGASVGVLGTLMLSVPSDERIARRQGPLGDAVSTVATDDSRKKSDSPKYELYVTNNTYLCGVGELDSSTRYIIPEANN